MLSAAGSVLCSPSRLAAPPAVEQTPGDTPDPAPTGLIRDRLGSDVMPRRYADGFARFGAISTRSSFALGENFLDARVVSLRVDDADGWSVVDGGAAAPEVLGEDRFDAYRASHPPVRMYVHLLYSGLEGASSRRLEFGFRHRSTGGPLMVEPDRSAALDRSSAMPLWAQLHADLVRRIGDDEFAGSEFPGEHALTTSYGVSRHTTREALRHLRNEGILIAERGRPSRLAGPPVIEQPLGALYSLFAAVEATGVAQHSVVRALELRTDPAVAVTLQVGPKAPLLYLERIRMAGAMPLALDYAWLPGDLARDLLDADFTHTALYIELEQRCGIRLTGGREDVTAVVPDRGCGSTRTRFEDRRAVDPPLGLHEFPAGGVAAHSVRGDRFTVSATFSPSEAIASCRPRRCTPCKHPLIQGALFMTGAPPEADPAAAHALIAESGAILIDVREDDEWAAGHARTPSMYASAISILLPTLLSRNWSWCAARALGRAQLSRPSPMPVAQRTICRAE